MKIWVKTNTGDEYIKKLLSDESIKKFQKIDSNVDRMMLLSIGNSAIRPAGASYREDLAQGVVRKTGSKALDDFLKPTFGYLVFQCQIIEFLHEYCGFTMGQADVVRRHFAKKYGTDKDIPIIKNGGYMGDSKDNYIKGFIQTMKEKYDMQKEEAENTIVYFLQVIEDASNYLFSLNHSQPYSYEGYVAGWLRYYYPLEFLTVALNINIGKEEKTNALSAYATKVGIKIHSPQFRKSKSDYAYDKELNSIYKGISSIKHINNQCGDFLWSIKDNKYNNFVNLLEEIKKSPIDSRQLEILIKMNFFEEFGNPNQLMQIVDIYNTWGTCKTVKKDKISSDIEPIIIKYSSKATAKQYSQLDNIAIVNELSSMSSKQTTVEEYVAYQIETLGYTDIVNPHIPYCAVENVEINKYGTPYVGLYCIATGNRKTVKADKNYFNKFKLEPCDIIKISLRSKPKKRKDANGKWFDDGEETVLCAWKEVK